MGPRLKRMCVDKTSEFPVAGQMGRGLRWRGCGEDRVEKGEEDRSKAVMVFNSSVRRRDAWSAATREDGRTGVRGMQTEAEATCSSRPKPSQAYAPPKLFRVLVVGTMDRRLLYGSQAVRHQRPTPRSQPNAIWSASKHWASAVLRLHLPSSASLGVPQKQSKKSKRAVAHPPNAAHRGGAAKLESNTLRQGLLSLISASWLRCGGAPCRSRGFCTSVRSLCLPIKHATSRCNP